MPADPGTTAVEAAVELLRAAGWLLIPPAGEALPEPAVGQVWRSSKPRVEPRTIIAVGMVRGWGSAQCVSFTSPSKPPHPKWGAERTEPRRLEEMGQSIRSQAMTETTTPLPGERLLSAGLVMALAGATWMPVGIVSAHYGYFPLWMDSYSFWGTLVLTSGLMLAGFGAWRLFR